MKLVKLKTSKGDHYFNPEHVAVVVQHPALIGSSVVSLPSGLAFEVDGTAAEIRTKLENPDSSVLV